MRLFVGLSLPESIRERLARVRNGLPGARWVPPENLHLTLRFIGEVDGGQAADIDDALSALRCDAFILRLLGLGHFGDSRRLRALWVGVEPEPILLRLQAKVEQALQRTGLPPEGRKFKPHVTLARFKSDPGPKLQDFMNAYALLRYELLEVREFVLFSSHLSQNGSIYREEAAYSLSQPPAASAGSVVGVSG